MKKIILSFSFILTILNVQMAQHVLDDIQQRIYSAYAQSLQSNNDEHQQIIEVLGKEYASAPSDELVYWMSFAAYRAAIYNMNTEEREKAASILEKGITWLKNLKNPSSEHLALHGSMLSLSIAFKPSNAVVLSNKADKLYRSAIDLNDQNLRAYLGIGRSDFYTPVKYGGGLNVESYLKQALNKPDASTEDPFTPTWGRDDAYYYLARFYQREGRVEEAKLYCKKGLKNSPDHLSLNNLKDQLF